MKILFVLKQKKNVDTFLPTVRLLVERGHHVALAVQEWSDRRDDDYRTEIPSPLFSVVRCPMQRADEWAEAAWLLRSLRDCAHYQQPALRNAAKLQARTIHKLREELRLPVDNAAAAALLREVPAGQMRRLESVFGRRAAAAKRPASRSVPEGAGAAALAARAFRIGAGRSGDERQGAGIPVTMLLYSWDNLSTKGFARDARSDAGGTTSSARSRGATLPARARDGCRRAALRPVL